MAECYVFAKQSPGPLHCGSPPLRLLFAGERPFFRSCGTILPSSLTWFLPSTLVCSTHPPVSVCGTGDAVQRSRAFLGRSDAPFGPEGPPGCPAPTSWTGAARLSAVTRHAPCAGAGMFACCPSATPFGLALGPDLPWGDEPGPGILGFAVGGILAPLIVTDACIVTRTRSTHPRGNASAHVRRSPTNHARRHVPRLRLPASSPDHFRRGASRPVSCYAIFKWWLPLSQHPGCHRGPTSLQSTWRTIRGLGRWSGLFPFRRRSLSPAV